MTAIQISVIDASNQAVTEGEVRRAVSALHTQIRRDFAPIWGIDADLSLVPKDGTPDPASWWLVVLDHSDQAGAVGYHDLTPEGLPLGKVFAGTDKRFGYEWTVTASHELLEMLADPDISLAVLHQGCGGEDVLVAYEVCDPCENDAFGYRIDGVTVSNFVYPAWFESFRGEDAQFDCQGQIHRPFDLLDGGSRCELDLRSATGWRQVVASGSPASFPQRPRLGSRRERRRTPRQHWVRSHPK